MRSRWQQFAAWSCLVVVLLQGGVMGRGLVLCVEPDGAVNLEATRSGLPGESCGECPGPKSFGDESKGGASERAVCPCVDIAVVSGPDRVRPGDDPLRLLQHASYSNLPATFDWSGDVGLARGGLMRSGHSGRVAATSPPGGVGLRI